MKFRPVIVFAILCLLFGVASCYSKLVGPPFDDGKYTYVINNQSDYPLTIRYYKYSGVDKETRTPLRLVQVLNLNVPSKASGYQDIYDDGLYTPVFDLYKCVIVFDDGKELEYCKSSVDDHIISLSSPLSVKAYDHSMIDGMSVYTFTVTNEHYRLAE